MHDVGHRGVKTLFGSFLEFTLQIASRRMLTLLRLPCVFLTLGVSLSPNHTLGFVFLACVDREFIFLYVSRSFIRERAIGSSS